MDWNPAALVQARQGLQNRSGARVRFAVREQIHRLNGFLMQTGGHSFQRACVAMRNQLISPVHRLVTKILVSFHNSAVPHFDPGAEGDEVEGDVLPAIEEWDNFFSLLIFSSTADNSTPFGQFLLIFYIK